MEKMPIAVALMSIEAMVHATIKSQNSLYPQMGLTKPIKTNKKQLKGVVRPAFFLLFFINSVYDVHTKKYPVLSLIHTSLNTNYEYFKYIFQFVLFVLPIPGSLIILPKLHVS